MRAAPAAAPSNASMATLEADVTFTRLPYYMSSEWGSLVKTDGKLIQFSNTELQYRDYPGDGSWRRFFEYEGVSIYGLSYSVGSVGVDPSDEEVLYFCSGETYSSGDDDIVDYHLSMIYGSLFRSVNGLENAQLVAGHDDITDTYRFGCADFGYARYVIDTAANGTEIEGWKIMARNDLFAFDDRSKVSVGGKSISANLYYLSYMRGLYKGTYDSGGNLTWSVIHKDPVFYDNDDSGRGYAGWTPSYDERHYQYAPQSGAAYDERLTYPPETNAAGTVVLDASGEPNCDYVYNDGTHGAQAVEGNYESGSCYEDESHALGTDLEMDRTALSSGNAVLYAGYMNNELFTHGGLYRGVEDASGNFSWTEIEHPDGVSGHLDVRDIELDATSTVTLDDGTVAARTFYVAAGRHGVFKGTLSAAGAVTLTAMNDGLYPRVDMLADYPSYDATECSDTTSCGQALFLDHEIVDGTDYLLLQTSDGVHYGIDDGASAVQWREIVGFANSSYPSTRDGALSDAQESEWGIYQNWGGWAEGGLIDTDEKVFIVPAGSLIYTIDISSLSAVSDDYATADWHAIHDGYGDRAGQESLYDPVTPDTRSHFVVLDYAYDSYSWEKDMSVDDPNFDRTLAHGLCYETHVVSNIADINSYVTSDADGDAVFLNATYLGGLDTTRHYYYGGKLVSSGTGTSAVMYIGASHNGNDAGEEAYYGGMYRGTWDAAAGDWAWKPATGEKNCVAKYPSSNANQNFCHWICEEGPAQLPLGRMYVLAVDPNDANHVYTALEKADRTDILFYETSDGGVTWTDISASYVNADTGASLFALGYPTDMAVDPNDGDVVFASFGTYGVYRRDAASGKFVDITDAGADDNATSPTLTRSSATAIPKITDLELVDEGAATRAYFTAAVFCDTGWHGDADYPQECGTLDGGGVYARLIGTDASWTKLNYGAGDSEFFPAEDMAVSPADPNRIVAVGYKDNLPQGGTTAVPTGVFYSKDKGVSWHKLTDSLISAGDVTAHPTDSDRFIVTVQVGGPWELNLSNPDSDGDGTRDQWDADDQDGDGLRDDIDPNPSKSNTWYWVNSATGTVLAAGDAWDGKSYTYLSGTYSGGTLTVDGVVDASKAHSSVFRDCQGNSSSSSSDSGSKPKWTDNFSNTKISPAISSTRPTSATAPAPSSGIKVTAATGIATLKKSGGTYGICILNESNLLDGIDMTPKITSGSSVGVPEKEKKKSGQ